MNGEINGIMEKSVESPADLFDTHKDHQNSNVKSEHDDSESDSSTNAGASVLITQSITVDDGSSIETKTNSDSEQSDFHSIINHHDEKNEKIILVREPEGTVKLASPGATYDTAENDCGNSNESFTESETSSQAKSIEQLQVTTIELKYNDTSNSCDNTQNSDNSEDSSDEGSEVKADDTMSINSESADDDGSSQGSENKLKTTEIIMIDNDRSDTHNGSSQDSHSPEVHEVDSENESFTVPVEKMPKENTNNSKTVLRRSSRTIKRRKFSDEIENGDDESDVEEIEMLDPLRHKARPIVINDTKKLVEMAAKHSKATHDNRKKEPTVVIIDSPISKQTSNKTQSSINAANAQALYQNMIARGTTVTPVSSKNNAASNNSSSQTPTILPSLTDDMYVVEAPSFIVPYVYEKPSMHPFREFVDILGKELEEQKAKEDAERQEKINKEKDKRSKERQERRDKGEEVEDSEEEEIEDQEDKKKKVEKKERRRHRKDDDDVSWDGESTSESEEDVISDDEDKIHNKAGSVGDVKEAGEMVTDKSVGKSESYFDCSLGKFFMDIGYNLVQEFVQTDLLKQQNRKLNREKKLGHNTKATESSIASLMKNLELSKENNAPYAYVADKCQFCTFKTESTLVMANHLETPHMKNNVYKCNFCEFEIRSPHDILRHMKTEHNIVGKLEKAPSYHECPNCPFEDNGKGKLARHQIPCAKKFKPATNLAPPIEWEPPAKIPKITKSRNNVVGPYQNQFNRHVGNTVNRHLPITNMMGPGGSLLRPRGRAPISMPPRGGPIPVHGAPIVRGGVMIRHNSPTVSSNYPTKNKPGQQPSISITPLPRQPQPVQPVQNSQATKGSFVICEICDGYIKDLEQLRNHMQWIHKVKIHPKMIYNRPPLNCQKCQFRFFTDQGLERHLLGSHGLVTSSMQEAANKGKDAGRCPVCGRVYQWKLLNHVARDHSLTLKPAHLSYKCTVCTATFGMYKLFENHVYSAHSVVAKRVMDKSKNSTQSAKASTNNDSLLKPLKINDEITIIPQPVKASAAKDK